MHIVTRTIGVLVGAVAFTATTLSVTHAAGVEVSVEDRLERIALVDDPVPVGQSPLEPVASDGGVTIDTAQSSPIRLNLPVGGTARVSKTNGRYVLSASDDASLAVTPTPNGTQILVGVESAEAPTSYDFGLDTAAGFLPQLTAAGAVDIVNQRGEVAAQVEAPWAVDADGRRVPTRFEVRNGTIRQVVDHRAGGFAYPIIADPKIFRCDAGLSICVKFTKKETRTIAKKSGTSGVGATAFAAYLCGKIPHSLIAAVCVGTVAAVAYSLRTTFTSAAKSGRCVELHFWFSNGLLWKWKQEKC